MGTLRRAGTPARSERKRGRGRTRRPRPDDAAGFTPSSPKTPTGLADGFGRGSWPYGGLPPDVPERRTDSPRCRNARPGNVPDSGVCGSPVPRVRGFGAAAAILGRDGARARDLSPACERAAPVLCGDGGPSPGAVAGVVRGSAEASPSAPCTLRACARWAGPARSWVCDETSAVPSRHRGRRVGRAVREDGAWLAPPARGARRAACDRGVWGASRGPRRLDGAVSQDNVPKPQQKANPTKINNGPGQARSVAETEHRPRGIGGPGDMRPTVSAGGRPSAASGVRSTWPVEERCGTVSPVLKGSSPANRSSTCWNLAVPGGRVRP